MPDEVIELFNWPNPSTMALGPTELSTETRTYGLPCSKAPLVRKADNPTAICQLTE
jgi:hypothetical protein